MQFNTCMYQGTYFNIFDAINYFAIFDTTYYSFDTSMFSNV